MVVIKLALFVSLGLSTSTQAATDCLGLYDKCVERYRTELRQASALGDLAPLRNTCKSILQSCSKSQSMNNLDTIEDFCKKFNCEQSTEESDFDENKTPLNEGF